MFLGIYRGTVPSEYSEERVPRNIPRKMSLGIIRGNSSVGIFLSIDVYMSKTHRSMNVRGNIPTKFSLGIFRGHFRQNYGPRNFLGNLFPRNSVGKFRGISDERRNSEELFPTTCFVEDKEIGLEFRHLNLSTLKWWDGSRKPLKEGKYYMGRQLRLLEWWGYPMWRLPSYICAENLVELIMPDSRLTMLWTGVQAQFITILRRSTSLYQGMLIGLDCLTSRREEDRMCDFRRNYGSVGATLGSSLCAVNFNRWTPLMVARSWHRNWLEEILNSTKDQPPKIPYPFLCLPVMSIIKIALVCGRRENDCLTPCRDPFPVSLERTCTDVIMSSDLSTINHRHHTHTRVIHVPSFPLSRRNCLFHQTFQYNNKKTSNVNHQRFWQSRRMSVACFKNKQLIEITAGLEASGASFIWVVRKSTGDYDKEEWLPKGFEDRTKEKGMVIRGWAPQVLILEHQATGGFMTHCGWNLLLEGVAAGLPMVTWPIGAEQFYNEKLVTQVLRTGVSVGATKHVRNMGDEIISREKVEKAVREVLAWGEEEERRIRIKKLAEMAKAAVAEGGSSFNDLNNFIHEERFEEEESFAFRLRGVMKDLGKTGGRRRSGAVGRSGRCKIDEIGNGRHSSDMKLFLVWSEL
ncbi:hypothetical protein F2Q69_00011581 [Brassica cretica]|uniref:UDP-glycosyltransferases domain-containing protein n=1 Tax=Brassica cretica TaxID=69181 RepID=A0A8S9R1X9_BRACR|nr:hypothetical protein F2Q69_00011581 [Brassica cretica]